jgi:hypothetical protein
VLEEGFVPFPKKLLRSLPELFPKSRAAKELSALLAVVDFKRPNLTRFPSIEFLAFVAGLPPEEFREAVGRLKEKGYISVAGGDEGLDIQLDGLLKAIERETE